MNFYDLIQFGVEKSPVGDAYGRRFVLILKHDLEVILEQSLTIHYSVFQRPSPLILAIDEVTIELISLIILLTSLHMTEEITIFSLIDKNDTLQLTFAF